MSENDAEIVQWMDQLEKALEHLSAPASFQIDHLTSLGSAPLVDELALEFGDLYGPLAWRLSTRGEYRELLIVLASTPYRAAVGEEN